MMILYRFRAAISICVRGTRHAPISIQIIWSLVDVPILPLPDVYAPVPIQFISLKLFILLSNGSPELMHMVTDDMP